MPRRLVVPLLVSLSLAGCTDDPPTSGSPAELPPNLITSGSIDAQNTHANVGALLIKRQADGQVFPICSGTLISATVFLTAGHCTLFFETVASQGFTAAVSFDNPLGWGNQSGGTTVIGATQVVTNPGYNISQADPADIGVLILPSGSTAGITPATLPALGLLNQLAAQGGLRNAVYTAVGYGVQDRVVGGGRPFFQDENPEPRRVAQSSFGALGPGYLRLSQNTSTGNGGTCYGDSGGPNFLAVNGNLVLVAITVTGDTPCRATNVDYRIDIASARAFLGQYVTLPP
jgi:hypothetical protein